MTPDEARQYADLQARLKKASMKQASTRSRAGGAGTSDVGRPCHVPGCTARFALLTDWERHAAATGHDARRFGGATRPALRSAPVQYSSHLDASGVRRWMDAGGREVRTADVPYEIRTADDDGAVRYATLLY